METLYKNKDRHPSPPCIWMSVYNCYGVITLQLGAATELFLFMGQSELQAVRLNSYLLYVIHSYPCLAKLRESISPLTSIQNPVNKSLIRMHMYVRMSPYLSAYLRT